MYLLVDSYSTVMPASEGRVGLLGETGNEVVSGAVLFKWFAQINKFEARLCSATEAAFESCSPELLSSLNPAVLRCNSYSAFLF